MNSKNASISIELEKAKASHQQLIHYVEKKYLKYSSEEKNQIKPGDLLRVGYRIPEGDKERIQYYEGLIISMQNRTLSKTFKIRRVIQGIGVEQTFLMNSPKIISIVRKQSSKVRRAKLFFIRDLKGKATRLKVRQ